MRKMERFIQQKQNDFNKLQEELDKAKTDIDKAEWDKGRTEKLFKLENQLKQKEGDCDILLTIIQT